MGRCEWGGRLLLPFCCAPIERARALALNPSTPFSTHISVTIAALFLGLLLVSSELHEYRHPHIEQTVRES